MKRFGGGREENLEGGKGEGEGRALSEREGEGPVCVSQIERLWMETYQSSPARKKPPP